MSLIVSWNINSVRSRFLQLVEFIQKHNPDIILLQEIKCLEEFFPKMELEDLGYNTSVYGQKSYNGVAILSKYRLEDVQKGLPTFENEEARYIEALTYINGKSVRVASVYVPNGQAVGSEKFQYKLKFLEKFNLHCQNINEWDEPFFVGGDYNVASDEIDVYSVDKLEGTVGFHIEERRSMKKIFTDCKLTDTFRVLNPSVMEFSWWDYRAGSWQNNKGMRIDQILASPEGVDLIKEAGVFSEVRGWEKASDHAPIYCRINI